VWNEWSFQLQFYNVVFARLCAPIAQSGNRLVCLPELWEVRHWWGMGSFLVDACAVCIQCKKCALYLGKNSMQHWCLVIGIWEIWSDLCWLATTGLFWIPCSRCRNAEGQMAGVSIKDLASEAKWLGRSWAGVGLGYIRNGMFLGNPHVIRHGWNHSCPNVSAAKWLLASRALPSVWDKE
jgi:hypothetical protein